MTIKDILFTGDKSKGICSVCSADPMVLEASFRQALKDKSPLLIEATCNQVNQYGGYTGMKPIDFRNYVYKLAKKTGFNIDNLILGGDHLGTQPFKHLKSNEAVEKACVMAEEYAKAGFLKIHLDASVPCSDDEGKSTEELTFLACERSALMAERITALNLSTKISYVIGTEVPTPGGALEDNEVITPTKVADAKKTIDLSLESFNKRNLSEVMDNVIALVVQPGVEFSDTQVHPYNHRDAAELSDFIKTKSKMVFEAHSTDYQTTEAFKELVNDGFAILKVGPALTYAKRRALFALARIENELVESSDSSRLIEIIENVMISDPGYWESYYHGDERNLKLSRQYSLSDRVRYYWTNRDIAGSVDILIKNMQNIEIPQTLILEFLPKLYWRIRDNEIKPHPKEIVYQYIQDILKQYSLACGF